MVRATPPTPDEIGAFRERMGWSLTEAADEFGVDRQTWWRWEQGTMTPPAYLSWAFKYVERNRTRRKR